MSFRPRILVSAAAAAVAALAGATFAAPAHAATSTSVFDSGWTVLAFGDAALGNAETEGSIAVGGDLSFTRGYPLIHTSGLTPSGYDIPQIGGSSVRLLVGGQFDAAASTGVSEVSSRGWETGDQLGEVRLGDTSNLAINPRGNGGVWLSKAGTASGAEPALHIPETVGQSMASVEAPGLFAAQLGTAHSSAVSTAAAFSSCVGHTVTLQPGSHGGERILELQAGTNVLNVAAGDLSSGYSIALTGVDLGAASLVVNVTGAGAVSLPKFSAAANTSASQPNVVAPYVVWNFGTSTSVQISGEKVSGSILAPDADLELSASSPIEGQIVAQDITSTGGEFHHYALRGTFECGTTPTSTSTTSAPTSAPTSATTAPSSVATSTTTAPESTAPTSTGSVAGESTTSPTGSIDATTSATSTDSTGDVAGQQETNGSETTASADAVKGAAALPDTGAAGLTTLLGVVALALLLVGGVVLLSARSRVRRH